MPDQTVPVQYPNTAGTTDGAIPADRQPPNVQETHPSTTATGSAPEVRHADDHDDATASRAVRER
jgi:hypothetical protein